MIIVEGPDGAGKSTLIKELSGVFDLGVADRHCTSEGGPREDLFEWAWKDVLGWASADTPLMYDRHPLISEYVYGPVIRGTLPQGFSTPSATTARFQVARKALLIFCLPPLEKVRENVHVEPQMPGVIDQIDQLYELYQSAYRTWPGRTVMYDYTVERGKGSIMSVVFSAASHLNEWKENHS